MVTNESNCQLLVGYFTTRVLLANVKAKTTVYIYKDIADKARYRNRKLN